MHSGDVALVKKRITSVAFNRIQTFQQNQTRLNYIYIYIDWLHQVARLLWPVWTWPLEPPHTFKQIYRDKQMCLKYFPLPVYVLICCVYMCFYGWGHAACSKFFRDKRSDKRQGGINYTWHLGALGMADWLRAKRAAIIIALGNCLAAVSGKFGDSLTLKVEKGMQWPICLCSATLQLLAACFPELAAISCGAKTIYHSASRRCNTTTTFCNKMICCDVIIGLRNIHIIIIICGHINIIMQLRTCTCVQ